MSETELSEETSDETGAEKSDAVRDIPSGKRVHRVYGGLVVLGAVAAFLADSGGNVASLGGLLLLGALFGWGWYSGPWRTFKRAGKPGWLSLVPVFNAMAMLQIAKRPLWWTPFWFLPGGQLVVGGAALHSLSKRFGRSPLLSLVLFLGASVPVYMASMSWLSIAISEGFQGKFAMIAGLGVKAFIAGVHLSILAGCLPLGLGALRPNEER